MVRIIFHLSLLFTFMGAQGFSSDAAQTDAVIPFFIKADGKAPNFVFWTASFEILNTSPETADVTVTGITDQGDQQELATLSIPGFQMGGLSTTDIAGELTGWVRINSTQPVVLEVSLQHLDDLLDGEPTTSLPRPILLKSKISLEPKPLAMRHIVHVSWREDLKNTGLSVVFPTPEDGTGSAKGKLTFRWVDGRFVTEREFAIPPNSQILGLFTDPLPESLTFGTGFLVSGTVEIEFDQPVAVLGLETVRTSAGADLNESLQGILVN